MRPREAVIDRKTARTTFEIKHRSGTFVVEGRDAAVQRAKELSQRGRARLERMDGKVSMTFANGHLTQYVHDIGGRRR